MTDYQNNQTSERILVFCLLAGAFFSLVLRFFSGAHSGIDIGIQIQAAQNLIAGNGLKTWAIGEHFLVDRPAIPLTHFPCGFSWAIAFLLKLQIPLAICLKIYGLIFTLLGWLGWAFFLIKHFKFQPYPKVVWTILLGLCSFALPIFSTPGWYGTDIVPWALVPWMIVCLLYSIQTPDWKSSAFCFLAGLIAGFAFIFRYAGVVFFVFGFVVILLGSIFFIRKIFARVFAFGLGCLPFVAVQFYYIFVLGPEGSSVGGIQPSMDIEVLSRKAFEALQQLPAINNALLFWLPDRVKNLCVGGWSNLTGEWPLLSYAITSFLLLLPLQICYLIGFKKTGQIARDPKFVLSLFVPVVGLFLFACTVQGTWSYAGDRRYYLPLVPLTCILFVLIGFQRMNYQEKKYGIFMGIASKAFCCLLSISLSLFFVFLFLPGAYGNVARAKAEISFADFPNLGFDYEKFKSREIALNWIHRNPEGHVLTNFIDFFLVDDSVDQRKIHRVPASEAIRGKRVYGPMRILFVGTDFGDGIPRTVDAYGNLTKLPELLRLPNKGIPSIFEEKIFPGDKIQVFQAYIDEGQVIEF